MRKAKNKTTYKGEGNLSKVINIIVEETNKAIPQLAEFSVKFKADSLEKSAYLIWKFIKDNIKYVRDAVGIEEIRTPQRTLSDKIGDCEDYAIFALAILSNLGYKPKFYVVAMGEGYQHIYTVINKHNIGQHPMNIIIDGVMNTFNQHPDNITKYFIVNLDGKKKYYYNSPKQNNLSDMNINVLSGNYNAQGTEDPISQAIDEIAQVTNLSGLGAIDSEVVDLAKQMHELEKINEAQQMLFFMDVEKSLDESLSGWVADQRKKLAEKAARIKAEIKRKADQAAKKAKALREAANKRADELKRKAQELLDKAKNAIPDVVDNTKKFGLAPVRGAFLLLLKVNFLGLAKRLYVGYMSKAEAVKLKLNMKQFTKAVNARIRTEKLFVKAGGTKAALKKAALSGRGQKRFEKGLEKMSGLGDPVTIAAVTSAIGVATPLLAAVKNFFKTLDLKELFKKAKDFIPDAKNEEYPDEEYPDEETSKNKKQANEDDSNGSENKKNAWLLPAGLAALGLLLFTMN